MFDVAGARAVLPEVRRLAGDIIALRADLAELLHAIREETSTSLGGVAEAKALEARLDESVSALRGLGLHVKGIAPVLVDFPATLDDRPVLLCWLESETELGWYHVPELGFLGRRPLP